MGIYGPTLGHHNQLPTAEARKLKFLGQLFPNSLFPFILFFDYHYS